MYGHLLFDGALHAFKANAELIFEKLADSAGGTIAEMVNVVRLILRRTLAHLQNIRDNVNEVLRREKRIVNAIALWLAHLDVELQASHTREVELARVEEHTF